MEQLNPNSVFIHNIDKHILKLKSLREALSKSNGLDSRTFETEYIELIAKDEIV